MTSTLLRGLRKFEKDERLNRMIFDLYNSWIKTYPNIDVKSQIQWAHNWLLENPSRDKKDYVRYLGNWMRSAQQRAVERKTNVVVPKPYKEDRPKVEEVMSGEDWNRLKQAIRKL